jgi:pseudouridine-5'-monophosphatase
MLKRAFSHVIFDMDGVLLDTEPLYTQATQQVIEPYGKVFDWSIKCEMMGRKSEESAQYLVERLALPISAEEVLARSRPILEQLFTACREMRGAERIVRALSRHGVPLAIATSSKRRLYEIKTRPHAWFDVFDVVICGDDARVRAFKPAPDIFLAAAEDLGAAREHCLVFEDSIAGLQAARAAGMQVAALPDPNNDRTRFSDADWVLTEWPALDPDELLRWYVPKTS